MSDTGRRVKQIRKSEGLTREAFGAILEIPAASVYRIETGAQEPSEQTRKLIWERFGVSLEKA